MGETKEEFRQRRLAMQAEVDELEADLVGDPENPRTWLLLTSMRGVVYRQVLREEMKGFEPELDQNELYEKAVFAARKTIELQPDRAQNYINLIHFLCSRPVELSGLKWTRLSKEDRILNAPENDAMLPISEEVFDLCQRALQCEPDNPHVILLLSRDYYLVKGELDKAEELAKQVTIDSSENYSMAFNLLFAQINLKRGNFDLAIARYRELLKTPSNEYFVRLLLIEAYRLAGFYEDMLSEAGKTLEMAPRAYNVYKSLALYYESQGLKEEAKVAHRTYLELLNDQLFTELEA